MPLIKVNIGKISMSRDGKEWDELDLTPEADMKMKAHFNSRFTPPIVTIIGEKVIIGITPKSIGARFWHRHEPRRTQQRHDTLHSISVKRC